MCSGVLLVNHQWFLESNFAGEDIRRLLLSTDSVERPESRSSQCVFGGFRVFLTWDYAFLIGQSEFSTLRPVPGLLIDKPWVRGWMLTELYAESEKKSVVGNFFLNLKLNTRLPTKR